MAYEVQQQDDIVIVKFLGTANIEVFREALMDDTVLGFVKRLYDISDGVALTAEDLAQLVQISMNQAQQPRRLAAVAQDNLAYGFSRMFESYRENGDTKAAVFRDFASAIAWLQEDG